METWREYRKAVADSLDRLAASAAGGTPLSPDGAFQRWVALTREVAAADRHVYIVGNGGSAMIAGHFATDACKNAKLRCLAFNDAALLTASANDLGFGEVFAVPLAQLGRAGDLLITISSSGSSPNILRAIEVARAAGMTIVTLSGKRADNLSRSLGDLNFYVPADRYGWVESAHHILMHHWLDQYLNAHGAGAI
ncbi:MAG: SIS domain-containing protein [Acidobacteria bacterium]|nr:SIS domain-containing protein [Acidobacteriota bacterium]